MNRSRNVLFINLGWEQEPLLQLLADKGYQVFGYHYDHNYSRILSYKDVCIGDLRDLEKILNFAKSNAIDAVVSDACDYSYFAQAYVSEILSCKGARLSQAQVAVNKLKQRQVAYANGVKVPRFSPAYTYAEAAEFANSIGYPIIIKPVDNRGSFGVFKVANPEDLEKSFYSSIAHSHSRVVLVEQYIHGQEFTVDGYCINGEPVSLAVAVKSHALTNQCVATRIVYSSNLAKYAELKDYNSFVARALGMNFGMLHAEYIIDTKGDIYLVEMANRGGGVYTSTIIVPEFSGVNVKEIYLNDCLGISSSSEVSDFHRLDVFSKGKKVVLHFFSFPSGKIKSIFLPRELLTDPRVLKLKILISPEQVVPPILSDAHRHGFVIISLEDSESEVQFIEFLYNSIQVEYEQTGSDS